MLSQIDIPKSVLKSSCELKKETECFEEQIVQNECGKMVWWSLESHQKLLC